MIMKESSLVCYVRVNFCLTTFEMTTLTIVCLLCHYSYLHSESKESYNQGCERPSDQGLLSRRLRAQEDATEHQEENWYLYPYSNLVRRHQAVLRCQHAQISHWQHDHWRHRGKSRGYWLKYDHRDWGHNCPALLCTLCAVGWLRAPFLVLFN